MQMEKKAKRTDEFDPMRDKNDLKERFLGQNFTQNRQSEFTKMNIIQNFSEQKTSPGYTWQD